MGEVETLAFICHINLGNFDRADGALLGAKACSYGIRSPQLASELDYQTALLAWAQRDYPAATAACKTCLANNGDVPPSTTDSPAISPFTVGYWKARALELLGMTAGLESDFINQAAHLKTAFEHYDEAQSPDAWIEAKMIHNLAVVVRDIHMPTFETFVRERLNQIVWNASLAREQFYILQCLGWCSALRGDHVGAFRDLRASFECAPTIPLKIAATIDRAFLARELGDQHTYHAELETACTYADALVWADTLGSDHTILMELARIVAGYNAVRARGMLEHYNTIKKSVSPLELFYQDRRPRAEHCEALAAIAKADGDLSRAAMLFTEAYEIWNNIGYAWRAAASALEVYTITQDPFYLDVVAREAAIRPLSWLARRYHPLRNAHVHGTLPAAPPPDHP